MLSEDDDVADLYVLDYSNEYVIQLAVLSDWK